MYTTSTDTSTIAEKKKKKGVEVVEEVYRPYIGNGSDQDGFFELGSYEIPSWVFDYSGLEGMEVSKSGTSCFFDEKSNGIMSTVDATTSPPPMYGMDGVQEYLEALTADSMLGMDSLWDLPPLYQSLV